MGARPSKLRVYYRKLRKSNSPAAYDSTFANNDRGIGSCGSMASAAHLLNIFEDHDEAEEDNVEQGKDFIFLNRLSANAEDSNQIEVELEGGDSFAYLAELEEMQREINSTLGALKEQLKRLEGEQKYKIELCAKKWRNAAIGKSRGQGGHRKLESLAEECRLRSALLADKFRNCTEYLRGFDSLIRSIQKEQQKNEDDDFLRDFLLKTAKRQHKKGQLSQAVDTFCQLLIATDGHLRSDEMAVLVDVCREKVEHTREFHERISGVVQQQMDNSPFVVDDLWGSVLEELRAECADAYEVVMRVRPMGNGERGNAPSQENNGNVEQLKYLLASTICALWLQITPYGHDEFDEIKELFFRTLDQYMKTVRFEVGGNSPLLDGSSSQLENTVRQLLGQCPKLAGSKKMRKLAERLFLWEQCTRKKWMEEPKFGAIAANFD